MGPVNFSELRAAALDPRLDMVWNQGMEDWKPAGEIEGLFEKRSPQEPQESLAPAVSLGAPEKTGSMLDGMAMESDWPGARRRSFLIATLLFPLLWNSMFVVGSRLLIGQLGPEIMTSIGLVAAFLPLVVGIYFSLMRLVNLGMSRWWLLGLFVPLLNLWVAYRCFACPAGYAYHKKLDGAGIGLAILYWLLLALIVAAAVAAWLYASELPSELQGLFEKARRSGILKP
jgi:hypothetical protein